MSGPACPYNYTGKFLPTEEEHLTLAGDPIKHALEIEKQQPYDAPLYEVRDPRLVSKTIVIRDYGCKIPIDLADTEKVARAVLKHYPDQYVAFLGEFVENLFGTHMRAFLGQAHRPASPPAGRVRDQPRLVGRLPQRAGRRGETRTMIDSSPVFTNEIGEALKQLARNGEGMTLVCSSQDVYDIRPCLRQHIETLLEMIDVWCRYFGTTEHALLIWWCNEQGARWCDDLKLINEAQDVDHDRIQLVVPRWTSDDTAR